MKLSINDINMQLELHAQRVDVVMEAVGAKPLGDWFSARDVGKTLTAAYYSLTVDREYNWDDIPERLKQIAMGLEYVHAGDLTSADLHFIKCEGSTYVKACDVDVYVHKKGLLGGWFKVYSRSFAKQKKINREELKCSSIALLREIPSKLSEERMKKLTEVEAKILKKISGKS